ncbi:MAG: M15 family metallopeptidase [Actinomycetaceae bacterium]|nr:M15 family metallopeptidase [Actinomycetaceae bacterium]
MAFLSAPEGQFGLFGQLSQPEQTAQHIRTSSFANAASDSALPSTVRQQIADTSGTSASDADGLQSLSGDEPAEALSASYLDASRTDSLVKMLRDPTNPAVIVNKQNPIAAHGYVPQRLVNIQDYGVPCRGKNNQLVPEAAAALAQMYRAAQDNGAGFWLLSGFRTESVQDRLYQEALAEDGAKRSAKPRYSEHQTGFAADISTQAYLSVSFGTTPAGIWLAANAWRYGFILRYPQGGESVTGFEYEPWHFRYIGVASAARMHESGARTYEEFVGLPAAPQY